MNKSFSIRECFSVGWMRFKEHAGLLIGVTALVYFTAFFFSYLTEDVYRGIEPTRSIIDLASSVLYYWLCFGLTVITLKLVDRAPTRWTDLFVFDRRFFFYLLGTILYGFVVGVGLVLLILPGVYLALRYAFFWYAIIDGKKGVFDAFHESAEITRGVKWQLILFVFATIGLMLLGFLLLGVGALITTPVVMLASTHLYRVLLKQSAAGTTPLAVPATPPRLDTSGAELVSDSTPPSLSPATPSEAKSQETKPIA